MVPNQERKCQFFRKLAAASTYTLSLDPNFAPFLILGASWEKLNIDSPLRGFVDNANDIPVVERKTAQQKCNMLQSSDVRANCQLLPSDFKKCTC